MAKRVIKMGLSKGSVMSAIRELEEYKRWLKSKIQELLDRLAQEGFEIASAGFASGAYQYDGNLDGAVVYPPEKRGENIRAIVAAGPTVLFIEFGTGLHYPDEHPESGKNPKTARGSYALAHGNLPRKRWEYYGEKGTNGYPVGHSRERNADLILTEGNPANMPMYTAVKWLRQNLAEIAWEVFNS